MSSPTSYNIDNLPEPPGSDSSSAYHAEVRAFLDRKPQAMDQPGHISASSSLYGGDDEQIHTATTVHIRKPQPQQVNADDVAGQDIMPSGTSSDTALTAWHFFQAKDAEHWVARMRCESALAALNAQPSSVSAEDRGKTWLEVTKTGRPDEDHVYAKAPIIKSGLCIDYGNVQIAPSAFIHRDVYLGDNPLRLAPITIGEHAILCPGVQILTIRHDVDWRGREGYHGPGWAAGVNIGRNAYIGHGAIVLPGCDIGEGCVVGAGAVVTRSMPAGHVVVGNPARPIWKVAPDVPDAPNFVYENDGEDMVVVSSSKKDSDKVSEELSGFGGTTSTNLLPPLSPDAEHIQSGNYFRQSPRDLSPKHYGRYWTPALAKEEKRQIERAITLDVVMLVAAILAAWFSIHCVLY
ncbi:hypothetical protein LTR17_011306 [Elasticomyces elasticus]|nr:hypothetical protein LTR17_011306 [Elasticomyces elasticus]